MGPAGSMSVTFPSALDLLPFGVVSVVAALRRFIRCGGLCVSRLSPSAELLVRGAIPSIVGVGASRNRMELALQEIELRVVASTAFRDRLLRSRSLSLVDLPLPGTSFEPGQIQS